MKKVLLIIGDAAEVLDTYYPLFRLQEEGYQVDIAGPDARLYHLVTHEKPPGWDITREGPGYHMKADVAFRDIQTSDYVGMVISGGRAPEYLRYDRDLLKITQEMMAASVPVASVCHGIEIIAAADVINGRKVTTVAKCRYDVEFSGGIYVDAEVVVDKNLVCARTWHDNPPWMREYIKVLNAYTASK
jgi:protease I